MDDQRRSPPNVEVLQAEPFRHRLRLWAVVAACCLFLVGVAVGRLGDDEAGSSSSASSPIRPEPRASGTQPVPSPSSAALRSRGPLTVDLGWLGAGTDYEVFIRTNGAVYRVQPALDLVDRTAYPSLMSAGPISFVAAAEAVFVHPLDSVSGFLIADDGTTRRWTGGGILFPGPDSRHVWRATGAESETSLALFDVQGDRATSTRLELPAADAMLVPDGQGYALAYASGGLYALRPTGITRISNGEVIATGPNRLLASRCDRQARCLPVVFDQRFQPLEPQPALQVEELGQGLSGVISADGRVAALTTDSPEDSLRLLDLRTGASRRIDLRTRSSRFFMTSQVAFSPDSRWLFVAGSDYRAHAVDVRTGEIRTLARHVTAVDQVAVRPQP